MNRLIYILTIVAGGLTSASANTVTVNCSTLTDPFVLSGNLVCPQFAAGLGTLTSVDITIAGATDGVFHVKNQYTQPQTVSYLLSERYTVGPVAGYTLADPLFEVMTA